MNAEKHCVIHKKQGVDRMLRAFIVLLVLASSVCFGEVEKPLLPQKPALNQTHIVFSYAGDLWVVPREGGSAQRLTNGPGIETDPAFSPDGKQVAFTGEYDGNVDIFVVDASGGVPRRLTYHPAADRVVGWTPDGKQILFRSARGRWTQLFTMPASGGFPTEVPLPMAYQGSFSPDGTKLAYVPHGPQQAWKRYRGGTTMPIWIANLADSSIEKLPRENSNDFNPMWVGNRIYFLSDRDGPTTLFVYDLNTKKVKKVLNNDGFDLKSASVGPGAIVYEQFGSLGLVDLQTHKASKVRIRLVGDLPEVRPRLERVSNRIVNAHISPTGVRAVFEARGEIFTVPAEKGDVRNLTNTPGIAERDPSWSSDGRWIAYFSHESGEYELHLREQSGPTGMVKKIKLTEPPSFFYDPVWSPNSKMIAFFDKRLNLWCVDVETKRLRKVDTNPYAWGGFEQTWSPDSRWLAYTKQLKSRMSAVFVYSIEERKSYQITDGMSDARTPLFDKSGKYLYFNASTDVGPAMEWNMASFDRPRSRSVYVVVLRKDLPSPLAPESDEEKVKEEKKPESEPSKSGESKDDGAKPDEAKEKPAAEAKKDEGVRVRIDFENIDQRILALPIPARNYTGMAVGKENILFILESGQPGPSSSSGPILYKFDLAKRKLDRIMDGVGFFIISHNGEKMLYRQGDRWAITSADSPKPGEGTLRLDGMEMRVDPPAEWKQMYDEVWRIERDFFYDPNHHGLDLKAAKEKYAPWLEAVASRADLNYLFAEMLGNLCVGHMYISGGDMPQVKRVPVGLLGADYKVENGRYRFAKVYSGENWNPDLQAPLTQPGVNVKEGEYLLAVNGRELKDTDNIYSFFEGTAGKSVVLKVGPNPDGTGSREVTVVPIENEGGLRYLAWVEGNRRMVDKMSNGRIAYVYLPNTAQAGYSNFNRYYFAQVGKDGLILDERFNGGGYAADYVIDYLRRTVMGHFALRDGADLTVPTGTIFGPKVMLINEFAGSGGDYMPYMFRRAGLGLLIGKRTWGGLIGIGGYPQLIDGGSVTAPHFAFYTPESEWKIENHGVDPDIEVEFDPKLWREGRDPQLEKAVEVVMEALKKYQPPIPKRPPYPNYYPKG